MNIWCMYRVCMNPACMVTVLQTRRWDRKFWRNNLLFPQGSHTWSYFINCSMTKPELSSLYHFGSILHSWHTSTDELILLHCATGHPKNLKEANMHLEQTQCLLSQCSCWFQQKLCIALPGKQSPNCAWYASHAVGSNSLFDTPRESHVNVYLVTAC